MYAHLSSARLAPKKANLMAKMVRGMPVPAAVELLRKTGKKSARIFEQLLRSAIANAEHNFKQDPQLMILKTVVVNQGSAYRRGIPMARGRVRPIRKFMCHITITLGLEGMEETKSKRKEKSKKSEKNAAMMHETDSAVTTKKKRTATKKPETPSAKNSSTSSHSSQSSNS